MVITTKVWCVESKYIHIKQLSVEEGTTMHIGEMVDAKNLNTRELDIARDHDPIVEGWVTGGVMYNMVQGEVSCFRFRGTADRTAFFFFLGVNSQPEAAHANTQKSLHTQTDVECRYIIKDTDWCTHPHPHPHPHTSTERVWLDISVEKVNGWKGEWTNKR